MSKIVGKKKMMILWMLPSLIGVTIFWLIPFIKLVVYSFQSSYANKWVGIQNYVEVLHNTSFQLAIKNTVKFTLICVPTIMLVSLICAVLLSENKFLNNAMKAGILLPLIIPMVSVSILITTLFDTSGYVNFLLKTEVEWLNGNYSFWILLALHIWKYVGIYMLIWLSGIANVSMELKEAASLDGAKKYQYVYYVLLPNLKQVAFVCVIFVFINIFKIFREIYLIAGDYPNRNIYMIQHIFNNWYVQFSFDKLAAGANMIAAVICIILCSAYVLYFKRND